MTRKKKEKEWSESRRNTFIKNALRTGSMKWPPKWIVMEKAYTGTKKSPITNRTGKQYRCNICKEEFPTSQVEVDHIDPVIDPVEGFKDWNTYIKNLFCGVKNLQVLCKPCHKEKTREEHLMRNRKEDSCTKKNSKGSSRKSRKSTQTKNT